MRKGALPDETGTWKPIWISEEYGLVGADGYIRTQSPPYSGVLRPGEYMMGSGGVSLVKGKISISHSYDLPMVGYGIDSILN
ncbi:MAG: hypothetical protein KME60_04570 [Cyanomargarita calcarea GSE-NOS-MK-12-04C]|jgi:hypothetical protein|uniref:Uncharacterized protein n=1 Tax=Cyanomargarita calcarea GSE-NOS-MK-12-04C TaxID=2839659 RepID=A0A951UTI0_9CYAN|nr:hypothetical protein [Cyanomargarita calcarea GSE-NOS-MK-12-04C]